MGQMGFFDIADRYAGLYQRALIRTHVPIPLFRWT